MPGYRIVALCSYDIERCSSHELVDAIRNHEFGIVRHGGKWERIANAALRVSEELAERYSRLERREADHARDLEAALSVREEFLSIVSHELKTPLASLRLRIDGLVHRMRRAALTPAEIEARLVKALEQCDRLDALVGNLLDVSRMRTGEVPLLLERGDLGRIVRDAVDRFAEELGRRGGGLTVEIEEGLVGRWDRTRVEQVMTNLLSNAIRHAPGADVSVRAWRDGPVARVEVRDSGPGIAPEHREHIFERFAQVGAGPERGGLGLGLWIVRELVARLGGRISVESEPGAGAAFSIALPFEPEVEA
jgi:signal transduction histidine kinase